MAKGLTKLKKQDKKRRFRKKIRFIRSSKAKAKRHCSENQTNITSSLNSSIFNLSSFSENSETDYCLNLSLMNWSHNFLQEKNIPIKHSDFYNILKKLRMNENEFVQWILYIEHYIDKKNSIDIETLLYIGLFVKSSLDLKSNDKFNEKIKKEKIDEIKSVLEGKIINSKEFNKKYNHLCKYNQNNKHFYYDINKLIESIYEENLSCKKSKKDGKKEESNKSNKRIEKQNEVNKVNENKNEENKVDENQKKNDNHTISNNPIRIDPILDENNDNEQEPNRDENWPGEGVEYEEYAGLPVQNEFQKLDDSVENLQYDNNLKGIFYYLQN